MLGVTGETRNAQAPEVPTMRETGNDLVVKLIFGLVAPAGTPDDVTRVLNESVNAALRDPEVLASVASFGADPRPGSPEEFRAFIANELKRWSGLARDANIKAE